MPGFLHSWKEKARKLKKDIKVLFLVSSDERLPWYVKAFLLLIIAYALSPIDLIPDFIPVLGYLDDLILLPLFITLSIKLIPKELLEEYRVKAETHTFNKKKSWAAATVFIMIWLLGLYVAVRTILGLVMKHK